MYLWCCQSRNERKLLYVTGGGKAGRGESREGGTGKLYNVLLPDVSGVSGGWFEARFPGPDLIIMSGMRRGSEKSFFDAEIGER